MKILILGPRTSIEIIKDNINTNDVELFELVIEDTTDIKKIINQIPSEIDGIFSSGKGVYYELRKYINNIPIHYTKRGIVSLSVAFINFIKSGKKYKNPSFDVVERNILDLLISDYDLDFDEYFLQTINPKLDESSYIKEHIELFHSGKADCVFTAFEHTYNYMKKRSIPVFRIQAIGQEIMEDFEKLKRSIFYKNIQNKMLLVHNFMCKKPNQKFYDFIEDYSSVLNAFRLEDSSSHVIFSNNFASKNELILLIEQLILKHDFKDFYLALATGSSVQLAMKNAEDGLKYCDSTSPIVFFDGDTLDKYRLSTQEDPISLQIEEISRNANIQIDNLIKILLYAKSSDNHILTTSDISSILKLTKRSALRIMNKLVKTNYASYVIQKDGVAGRPENSIKMKIY